MPQVDLSGNSEALAPISIAISGNAQAVPPISIAISGNAQAVPPISIAISGNAEAVPPPNISIVGNAMAVWEFTISLTGNAFAVYESTVSISGDAEAITEPPIPPPPVPPPPNTPITTCDTHISCECSDSPVTNYSSERPDNATFIGTYRFKGIPPLGVTFAQLDCLGICYSEVSQAEADLCAEAQSKLCVMDSMPGPPWKNPDGTSNFSLFSNQATSCTIDCATNAPCGDCAGKQTFTWTVAAGTVIAASQIEANLQAGSIACQQAVANKICFLTELLSPLCINEGAYKEIRAAGGTPWPWQRAGFCAFDPQHVDFTGTAYKWELISGALPPGITLGECTGTLVGVPTDSNTYTFTIKITDYIGSTQTREFSLDVLKFTNSDPLPEANVGFPYSEQITVMGMSGEGVFSLSAGTLPVGLSLSESGLISGTPTISDVGNLFTICVESNNSGPCCMEYSITTYNNEVTPTIFAATVSYFSGTFPAGNYRINYVNGAMKYTGNASWYINLTLTEGFFVQYDGGVTQVLFPAALPALSSQAAVEAANAGKYVIIPHMGGTIGVYLSDTFYGDNVAGTPTPTFSITPA